MTSKEEESNRRGRGPSTLVALALLAAATTFTQAETIPPSTTIPIEFSSTLKAGKLKPGDAVRARTAQAVMLPNGGEVPKGTPVTGHVTESAAFHFDESPYAIQKPSLLGVRFEQIELKNGKQDVRLQLRALVNVFAIDDGTRPYYEMEYASDMTVYQVGGDSRIIRGTRIFSPSGNVVEYVRKNGTFGHLQAGPATNSTSGLSCDAIGTEQAVGVFSSEACGLYGFEGSRLEQNGSRSDNTLLLSRPGVSVEIPAHSMALLEVTQ